MKTLSTLLVGLFVASATAQDAKKLIVGKWEATQKDPKGNDIKIEAEFKDDGKMTFSVRDVKVNGKYTLVDDKTIETETMFEGQMRKIKQEYKVTTDSLELKDSEGRTFTFKRGK
jgi:uncharacterized protein (TIGR03066 family)